MEIDIMCIIVNCGKNKRPSKDTLETCWLMNSDGAGIMYNTGSNVVIQKGFMDFESFYKAFKRVPKTSELVAHFRIGTSGKVSESCCHPFPMSNDYKKLGRKKMVTDIGVAHNGIVSWCTPKDRMKSNVSDTMVYIAEVMYYIPIDRIETHKFTQDSIEETTGSKFTVMTTNGVTMIGDFILNKEDGCYYSNSGYLGYRLKGGQTSIYTHYLTDYTDSPTEQDGIVKCDCCDCLVEETDIVYDMDFGMICAECAAYLSEKYGFNINGAVTF